MTGISGGTRWATTLAASPGGLTGARIVGSGLPAVGLPSPDRRTGPVSGIQVFASEHEPGVIQIFTTGLDSSVAVIQGAVPCTLRGRRFAFADSR